MSNLLLLALAFGISCAMTAAMRRYALSANIIDVPNHRSSHTSPTPRGGGVAIVFTFLAATAWLFFTGVLPGSQASALMAGGGLVAVAGYMDDRQSLAPHWRFAVQVVAAVWALSSIGGIPSVPLFGFSVDLGWFGLALATTYLVWMTNLYNFMDGIDGIASIEAITVALGGACCCWLAAATSPWLVPALLAACAAGFLVWNYPPAKIFMGDVGSGFLGMVIGVLSLSTAQNTPRVFWCWFILLGCFMVDTTTTLIRRYRRQERLSESHGSHAFQYAARLHKSHKVVTLVVGAVNVLWLFPLALLVALDILDGALTAVIAYLPLVCVVFRYKAGAASEQLKS